MSLTERIWAHVAKFSTFVAIILQAALYYPGGHTFDTDDQLHQATTGILNDWHPPLMAYTWRMLISLTGYSSSFFLLQLVCYWAAFGLIADGLIRTGKKKTGIFIFLIGLFPVFTYINGLIIKDSQMVVCFFASFAVIFWFKVQGRRIPVAFGLLAALLLLYGTLVRSNSVFALGPLLIYFFSSRYQIRYVNIVFLTLSIALLGIFLSVAANNTIPGVIKTQPIRSLQIFDLFGIAKYSRDVTVLSDISPLTQTEVDRCYTAYWWDSVSPWGTCPAFSAKFMNKDYKVILSQRDVYPISSQLTPMWLHAIIRHPAAYIQHRIRHFNAELNFLVPSLERRYGKTFFTANEAEIRKDYLKKNFMTWPIIWYVVALIVLTALRRLPLNASSHAARLLVCSGLTYGFAYFVIGVASDSRYMYWTILASFTGLVLTADQIYLRWKERDKPTLLAFSAIFVCIALGLMARLGDWQFMLA
jgi:hypothetical protein